MSPARGGASFKWNSIGLRIYLAEAAIDFFALATDFQNVCGISGARSGADKIRQESQIDDEEAHHFISGGAGKEPLKNQPHHGDPEQDAEYAIASNRKVGLDGEFAQVDQVERKSKLHPCIRKPGAGCGDPCGDGRHGGEQDSESADGIDEREDKDLRSQACDYTSQDKACDAKQLFLSGRTDGGKGGEHAGGDRCGEVGPVERNIQNVAKHRGHSSAKNVA